MGTSVSEWRTADTAGGRLYRAVHRFLTNDELKEVAQHGADTGWNGFTYTADCVRFYKRHEADIWEMLGNDACDDGMTIPALIAGFTRADRAGDADGFKNLLAWYALEAIARHVADDAEDTA